MNYYDHHIGDYDSATAHLSWVEDTAYRRLMCLYYRTERPIPTDINNACRLVRAQARDQRAAVEAVLREFFELRDDGWHQQRCDDEIAEYRAGEPEREARKTNESLRVQRHREERAALFGRLNAAGQHAAWNASIAQLRDMVKRIDEQASNAPATPETPKPATPVTETVTPPVTAPVTPATATQYPPPNTHLPDPVKSRESGARGSRLPADWTLPDGWAVEAIAIQPTWTPAYSEKIAAAFRDYWVAVPGQKGVKTDWLATWRNWARREGPAKVNGQGGPPKTARQVEAERLIRDFTGVGNGHSDSGRPAIDSTAERVADRGD